LDKNALKALKHILIMGLLAPWIGGTAVGYSAYLNTRVTDFASAVEWLATAAFGVLFFGLVVTILPNLLLTGLSWLVFWCVAQGKASAVAKGRATILLSFAFSFAYALMVKPIADDIGTSAAQLAVAAMLSGSAAAWLNYLNWRPSEPRTASIPAQPGSVI